MLDRIKLSGYKSIYEMDLSLGPLNVIIGANGAGKSNLINFFKLFNHMMSKNLQQYIGASGSANDILYYGAKRTPQMTATLHFSTSSGNNVYHMRLMSAAGDTLIFADEAISFTRDNTVEKPLVSLGAGHRESKLLEEDLVCSPKTAQVIKTIMQNWRVYHFHDTSSTANVKKKAYINDNHYLRDDAGNLAAFLYQMQKMEPSYYRRIITTIQSVAPFFGDFVLSPDGLNPNNILLNWRDQGADMNTVFGPHQLSDGTIRFMALITLLLQPRLPQIIIIDEPELGLHPYALSILVGLFKSISRKTQIIVSTQSTTLIDYLDPDNIIVVNRENDQSCFRRLSEQELSAWIEEYSLSELWEKNVLGGRPSR
ncbi:MAG: AAA family ATPase [Syntrophomonas sp.]|nr:AAA family ATPase [Syntrophomonas sp.]